MRDKTLDLLHAYDAHVEIVYLEQPRDSAPAARRQAGYVAVGPRLVVDAESLGGADAGGGARGAVPRRITRGHLRLKRTREPRVTLA